MEPIDIEKNKEKLRKILKKITGEKDREIRKEVYNTDATIGVFALYYNVLEYLPQDLHCPPSKRRAERITRYLYLAIKEDGWHKTFHSSKNSITVEPEERGTIFNPYWVYPNDYPYVDILGDELEDGKRIIFSNYSSDHYYNIENDSFEKVEKPKKEGRK